MPQETSYSYISLLVGTMLVAGLASSGPILADRPNTPSHQAPSGIEPQPTTTTESRAEPSEGGQTTQPDEVRRHLGPVTVTIFLNCSYFEVAVEPTTFEYVLALVYRDTESGQRIPILAGPFTGSVDDPFGRTELQLVEVQVRVERVPPTGQFAPERCLSG